MLPRHLPLAALLTVGAGATHLAAAVPHFSGNAVYGALFVGVGWIQVLLAALLLASARRRLAWAAVGVNIAAVGAWAISRTVGLPLTHAEPVLLADTLTVVLEMAAVGVLVARLRGADFGVRAGYVSAGSLVAVLALAVGASATAIADLGTEGHDHGGQADSTDQPPNDDVGQVADSAHRHGDGTVHLHEAGKPHVHPDETVHLHQASAEGSADDGAPQQDDGHDHEHADGDDDTH